MGHPENKNHSKTQITTKLAQKQLTDPKSRYYVYEFKQTETVFTGLAIARLITSFYGKNDAIFSTVGIEKELGVSWGTSGPVRF